MKITSAYCNSLRLNGVFPWSELPVSPNVILPEPSDPKHIEKESEISPFWARMLGTDTFSIPSPNKPFGAAPFRNTPV
jgi:hypothetical protein